MTPARRILIRLTAGVPFGIYEPTSHIGFTAQVKLQVGLLFQPRPCPLATGPVSLPLCGGLIETKPNFVVNLCRRLAASSMALPADHCQSYYPAHLWWRQHRRPLPSLLRLALNPGILNMSPSDMAIRPALELKTGATCSCVEMQPDGILKSFYIRGHTFTLPPRSR